MRKHLRSTAAFLCMTLFAFGSADGDKDKQSGTTTGSGGSSEGPITVRLHDRLGTDQIAETITVTFAGKTQTMKVESGFPRCGIDFKVDRPGNYTYSVETLTTFSDKKAGGGRDARSGVGNGTLNVTRDSCEFDLMMENSDLDPYVVKWQKRARDGVSDLQTTLEPGYRKVEKQRKLVTVVPGSIARVKVSRTVEHSIAFKLDGRIVGEAEVGLPLVGSTNIKASVSAAISRRWTDSTTVEDEVTLNGEQSPRYEIVWYDHIRDGTVRFNERGVLYNLPFQFAEKTEFEVTKPSQ